MLVVRPAGVGATFNRRHLAARRAALSFVAQGGIGGFDAVARQVGVIGGSPTVISGQYVGTAVKFNGSTHELRWSNRSTAVNKNMTIAWLGVYDGGGNASPFLSTSASTNTGWRIGTNTGFAVIKGGIVVLNASFSLTAGKSYFLAVSGNSVGTLNFVARDLASGAIQTSVVSDSNTPQACDGGIVLSRDNNGGEFLPTSCAAAMVGYEFLSMDALIDWAQDPWGFWRPLDALEDLAFSLPAAAGGAITGSFSNTLAALTLSGVGNLPIVGSLSTTLGALTLSGVGNLPLAAALAKTLDAIVLSAVGNAGSITGDLATTLASATLSSAGNLPINGTLAVTLAAVTLASAGNLPLAAALAQTLGAVTLASAGNIPMNGALAKTLATLTLDAAGSNPATAVAIVDFITRERRRRF